MLALKRLLSLLGVECGADCGGATCRRSRNAFLVTALSYPKFSDVRHRSFEHPFTCNALHSASKPSTQTNRKSSIYARERDFFHWTCLPWFPRRETQSCFALKAGPSARLFSVPVFERNSDHNSHPKRVLFQKCDQSLKAKI